MDTGIKGIKLCVALNTLFRVCKREIVSMRRVSCSRGSSRRVRLLRGEEKARESTEYLVKVVAFPKVRCMHAAQCHRKPTSATSPTRWPGYPERFIERRDLAARQVTSRADEDPGIADNGNGDVVVENDAGRDFDLIRTRRDRMNASLNL